MHDSGIIGKTSPPIQDEPASPIFALHLDAAENSEKSGNRTWVTRNTNSLLNYSTTTSLSRLRCFNFDFEFWLHRMTNHRISYVIFILNLKGLDVFYFRFSGM
ncbi:hypothetical protein Hanom_Chr10g00921171 [Helianthus anomalus]